jgi:hypothetical protein
MRSLVNAPPRDRPTTAMSTDTPERFPLLPRSISVLVSGHRREPRLPPFGGNDLEPAFDTLGKVLTRLKGIAGTEAEAEKYFPSKLYCPGLATVRVLTGQADYVDRKVVEIAHTLNLPVDLIVPGELPATWADKAEHSASFGYPQAVLEADNAAFATRDEFALSYADILVAVWDGGTPRGAPGGVVWLIQRAVAMGLPVLWIDPHGAIRTIAEHRVTKLWLHQLKRPILAEGLLKGLFQDYSIEPFVPIHSLQRRLNPLGPLVSDSLQKHILNAYADEKRAPRWIERRVGWFEQFMTAIFRVSACDVLNSLTKLLAGKRICKPRYESSEAPLTGPLGSRFAWSDARANIAGHRHGSGTWLLYTLSSAAVFASVAGMMEFDLGLSFWFGRTAGVWSKRWPYAELALIGVILYSFLRAGLHHWHRLWLGHRFVAEQIRYLKLLEPFLAVPAPFTEPLFAYKQRHYYLRSAELWLLQRSLSAGGLPPRYKAYHLASQSVPECGKRLEEDVEKQFGFHSKKHEHAHTLHKRMEHFALILFVIALACTFTHILADHWAETLPAGASRIQALMAEIVHWLPLYSASLPALGAALHGVMTKLEFGRISEQSGKVRDNLDTKLRVVRFAMTRPDARGWLPMSDLRDDARDIAKLLAEENVQWRDLIQYQKAELP